MDTTLVSEAAQMMVPNFFIIGAPKCGTTSLYEYLKDHPNIFMSPTKEPMYFDFDLKKPHPINFTAYQSLFSKADPNIHKAVGEASTSYLYSEVAVSEILRNYPNAKFIVTLRNPVDFVQSWHSENVYNGHETILDLEKAWRAEHDRKAGNNIPVHCPEIKKLFYSERGRFGDQIERLYLTVSKERVKVILFNDLISKTKETYEEVLEFLGVPSDGRASFEKLNENKILRSPRLQQALRYIGKLKKKIGLNKNFGLLIFFHKINLKRGARKNISDDLRSELIKYFQKDIAKLSKLIDRDLSQWSSNKTPSGANR